MELCIVIKIVTLNKGKHLRAFLYYFSRLLCSARLFLVVSMVTFIYASCNTIIVPKNRNYVLVEETKKLVQNVLNKKENEIIVLNFWATWCQPCISETEDLNKLVNVFSNSSKQIKFIAITKEDSLKCNAFFYRRGKSFDYQQIYNDTLLTSAFSKVKIKQNSRKNKNKIILPLNIVISEDGEIIYYHKGNKKDIFSTMHKIILSLLNDKT